MPLSLILGATASTRTNLLAATKGYDCAQFKQNSWASFSTAEGKAVLHKIRLSITNKHLNTHIMTTYLTPPSSMQRNHGASLPIRRSLPSAQMTPNVAPPPAPSRPSSTQTISHWNSDGRF
ncbi:hypothetical protein K456DRAFT_50846 [Colletotrichum gloeosporioides 23]|nr:hypothetical protein K456DRAFT_50846 [Colletotrichum gloeosporioides 23]